MAKAKKVSVNVVLPGFFTSYQIAQAFQVVVEEGGIEIKPHYTPIDGDDKPADNVELYSEWPLPGGPNAQVPDCDSLKELLIGFGEYLAAELAHQAKAKQ